MLALNVGVGFERAFEKDISSSVEDGKVSMKRKGDGIYHILKKDFMTAQQ
jgi:hypothetical protein